MRGDTENYRELFLNDVPMMDARAPVEFGKGAFPGVVNLPLMNDVERQKVGTCYKQQGQQAAIELGHQLVSGQTKAERIEAWAAFAKANPEGYLYCFRGGLRSQIVQQWLKSEAGIDYPRVVGGYKAMRTFLLQSTDEAIAACDFVLVGGMTGTGKTEIVRQLAAALRLGLALGGEVDVYPTGELVGFVPFGLSVSKKNQLSVSHKHQHATFFGGPPVNPNTTPLSVGLCPLVWG